MRMRRIGVVVMLVAGLTIAAAAPAAAVTVRGSGRRWRPATVNIDRGDRVRWRGISGHHTVTAYGGNWSYNRQLHAGMSVSRRFNMRGTYRFRCMFHSTLSGSNCNGMCGKVRV